MNYTKVNRGKYAATWGTPIGKDCISLDTSLSRWLGERLTFLGEHTTSAPLGWEHEGWKAKLHEMGGHMSAWAGHYDLSAQEQAQAYTNAQEAMRWVADNLELLWD